jgi:hypothetical protein
MLQPTFEEGQASLTLENGAATCLTVEIEVWQASPGAGT